MSQKTSFPPNHTEGSVTAGNMAVYKTTGQAKALVDGGPPGTSTVMQILTADPGAPVDDTAWLLRSGALPNMSIDLRLRVGGVTYNLPLGTLE